MDQTLIEKFAASLKNNHKIVFFGGAGVSTGSGIPDFRSADGLFVQDSGYKYSAEEIISHSFYQRYPEIFFEYYFDKLVYPEVQPNLAHTFLKDLEELGKDVSVVTQNIDGLHQKAGSSRVYELHGTVLDNYCTQCGKFYSWSDLEKDEKGIPRCSQDGAIVKPDVVLYQEQLNPMTIASAIGAIQASDLLIIAGTSLNVYPAASFIQYFKGQDLVVINKTPIQVQGPNAIVFEEGIEEVFTAVKVQL